MNQKLKEALADLFAMVDEGLLVRDTSRDSEPDYYSRMVRFVGRLAKAKQALEASE